MELVDFSPSTQESGSSTRTEVRDLVIVGAGIVGCSIAVAARRAGFTVTVIDRNTRPGFGSTSSSAGIIRVHAMDRESAILANASVPLWENWRAHTETPHRDDVAEFVRCGSIILDTGDASEEALASTMSAAGISFSRVDTNELASRFPYLDLHRFGPPASVSSTEFWEEPTELLPGALYTPTSGYVGDPALATQNLADQARRDGAEFLLGSTVIGFSEAPKDTTGVILDNGVVLHAAAVINAAGPHSKPINTLASVGGDFTISLRNLRQELHYLQTPEHIDLSQEGVHIVDGDLGINFRPDGTNAVLVGSNGDAVDSPTKDEDPDLYRSDPTRSTWLTHTTRVARRIPGTKVPAQPTGVAGLYDATEDWLPIYDRTDRPGFFVAIGTSGNQFKTAPVIGELMVQLVQAFFEGRNTDTQPLTFTPSGSDRSIDASVFSRLRSPNTGGKRG